MYDCAIGEFIDDALALALLLRSKSLQVAAVTSVQGDLAARGALAWEMVEAAHGWNNLIPVLGGCRGSLASLAADGLDGRTFTYGPHAGKRVHGRVGATPDTGIEMLAFGVSLTSILAAGPLTNIAIALAMEPETAIGRRFYAAVGHLNDSDTPDRTVRDDPEAAFLALSSGTPARLIPVDFSDRFSFDDDDFRRLSRLENGGHLVERLLRYRRQAIAAGQPRETRLRSTLMVVAAEKPEFFQWQRGTMRVELHDGPRYGHARFEAHADGPHEVAVAVQANHVPQVHPRPPRRRPGRRPARDRVTVAQFARCSRSTRRWKRVQRRDDLRGGEPLWAWFKRTLIRSLSVKANRVLL